MISAGSATSRALEAFKTGGDVEAAAYGTLSESPVETPEVDDQPESDDGNPSDGPNEDVEVKTYDKLSVTDKTGKREIELKWDDPEFQKKAKRMLEQSAGHRKIQSERDQLAAQMKAIQAEKQELAELFSSLEGAFKKQGAAGVVNLLSKDESAFEKLVASELEKRQRYAAATPEQRQFMDLQERLEAEQREKDQILADIKAEQAKSRMDREAADRASAEALVNPIFDKYRFAGKLGDSSVESQLDEAIWSKAVTVLQDIPEHELTKDRIEKEFRSISATFQKFVKNQSETRANAIVKDKKIQAKTSVGQAAKAGMTQSSSSKEIQDKVAKGDLKGGILAALTSGRLI